MLYNRANVTMKEKEEKKSRKIIKWKRTKKINDMFPREMGFNYYMCKRP